jgi:hypothetical protein
MLDEWLRRRNHPGAIPYLQPRPRVKYTGVQRVFDIAHKTILFACIGTSILLSGHLIFWMVTGEGKKQRELANASLAAKNAPEKPPDEPISYNRSA